MTILLAIDGVLITSPPWQQTELLADGFPAFNNKPARNLSKLIVETNAAIVLSTTQRVEYSSEEWKTIFKSRGIETDSITTINDRSSISIMPSRNVEIEEWVAKYGNEGAYVIIDDDTSLHYLPDNIKKKWVMIKPMLGLDDEAMATALSILQKDSTTGNN